MGQSRHTITATRWMTASRRMSAMAAALAAATMLSGCYYMSSDDEGEARAATPGTITDGTSDEQTRSYALSGFDAVTLAGPDNIIIRKGDRFSVTATGPKDTLDRLVIAVRDNKLEVKRRRDGGLFSSDDGEAQITITLPSLRAAALAGSGSMEADTLSGEDAEASIAGSGDLTLSGVDAGALDISIAGSGDMSATGRTRSTSVSIAGSGSVEAPQLAAETADISIAGSGSLSMTVSGAADVAVVGSGDVTLTGGARCTTSQKGSGVVSCR